MNRANGSRTEAKNIVNASSEATVFAIGVARQPSLKTSMGGEIGIRRGLRSSKKKIGAHAGIKSPSTISMLAVAIFRNCLLLVSAARLYLDANS